MKKLIPLLACVLFISVAAIAKTINDVPTRLLVLSSDIQDADLKTLQTDILLVRSESMLAISSFLHDPDAKYSKKSFYSASLFVSPQQKCYVNLYTHKHNQEGTMSITSKRYDDECSVDSKSSNSWKVQAQIEIPIGNP